MTEATQVEVNRFVKEVDEFVANLNRFDTSAMRANVYATNDTVLIDKYETTLNQANILHSTIEATTGAWDAARRAYTSLTDRTSMAIGDAVDEIRSWFGYSVTGDLDAYSVSPISGGNLGAFAAIQLPAAAWIAGIISAAYLLNQAMKRLMLQIDASRLQRANPTLSYDAAITRAKFASAGPGLFGAATLPLVIAGGLALWLFFGQKNNE